MNNNTFCNYSIMWYLKKHKTNTMIKYFFKLEWRNLTRNKYISALKISGLVIGMLVFMIAGYYVLHETSFDHFQQNASKKFHLEVRDNFGEDYFAQSLPATLTYPITSRYPEVSNSTIFETRENPVYIEQHDSFVKSQQTKMAFIEESFFDFYSYKFIVGNAHTSFEQFNPLIISEELAQKHFNGINSMGEVVKLRINDIAYEFIITGIVENPPGNSNASFHWIASLNQFMKSIGKPDYKSNWDSKCRCNVQLADGANTDEFVQKLQKDYIAQAKLDYEPNIVATNITKLHLNKHVNKRIKIFSALGILILIISVVNYVLLSTVERTQQLRYLGIEKISGAERSDLLLKNTISTILYAIMAFSITVGLFAFSKPYLSRFFEGLTSSNLDQTIIFTALSITILSIVVLATLINHTINRSQKPLDILKNKFSRGKTGKVVFNSLLVFQLIAFIALISAAILVQKQLNFMQESKLGFNQESLITLRIAPEDVKSHEAFKTELLRHPNITAVAATSAPPMSSQMAIYGYVSTDSLGNKSIKMTEYIHVDRDFFTTMQLGFKEGGKFPETAAGYCVVNQTFLDEKKIKDPMVEKVELGGKEYQICGILNDFHQRAMKSKINPFVVYLNPNHIGYSLIRFNGNAAQTVDLLKTTVAQYLPNTVFEYEFMDQKIKSAYEEEARFSKIINILTCLSVLIAVLGLLGLSYFSALVKVKEIGIRKVNGAKISEILALLNKDFIKWVAIAFVVACPLAYYTMNKWLENFAYKTELNWWVFAISGLFALCIALLTVTWQSWKAATRNPVEALRYE
ncbi:FtsX-like permease family protein [Puteibacter caeruleilacunae]|nr:FtsX-like permease family protein [Puteibacter caeruleilacunae]